MKPLYALLIALLPASLAAADGRPAPRPAARPVGAPVDCVQLNQIRETRVRDDWTIDFVGTGRRVWRNALPHRCPGLHSGQGITYRTSQAQLCSVDIVYSLQTAGGLQRGAGCGLGRFVPMRLEGRR